MTRMRVFLILVLTLFAVSPAFTERDRVQSGGGRGRPPVPVISTAAIPPESPLASRLEAVPDIKVETVAGQVPRLPSAIPAVYRNKAKGPDVRVVWPSPKDNGQFLKPGTTTVTGRVPGTPFQPKATVTVKEASKTAPVPTRLVEAFPLGQVVLDRDTRGVTPRSSKIATSSSAAWRQPIPTAFSTISGMRSARSSPKASSRSAAGTAGPPACAGTPAATTCRPSPRPTPARLTMRRCGRISSRR